MPNRRLPEIKPDDRVCFVGRTGAGKSYLARALLSHIDRLLVLDAKGTLNDDSWALEDFSEQSPNVMMDPEKTFRYRVPSPLDANWETFLWFAYYARNCTVYIDEVYGVEESTKPTLAMRALITRGRELGIGVWGATQRPSHIPLIILSEADWIFEFQLRLVDDRKRIASMIGPMGMKELRNHEVIVYNDKMAQPVFFTQANISDYKTKERSNV